MQQLQPPSTYAVSRPPKWLWALPVFSMGLLAFVPSIAIAAKARTSRAWGWAVGLAAAWLTGFAMVGADDTDGVVSDVGMTIYFAVWIGAVVHALVMGPKVAWSPTYAYVPVGPPPAPVLDPNSAAVRGVQERRRKRDAAREVARQDPSMARDLRIGRPDLPRQYDDGGLVDANAAPAEAMVQWWGVTPAQAAQVVEAREQLGRFEHVEDLVSLAGLEPVVLDQVRDRIVLL